jgi:hypothetical protein
MFARRTLSFIFSIVLHHFFLGMLFAGFSCPCRFKAMQSVARINSFGFCQVDILAENNFGKAVFLRGRFLNYNKLQ